MNRLTKIVSVVALSAVMGCAKGAYGPSIETPVTAAPRPIDKLTVEERRSILDRAQVFRSVKTATLDLLAGPGGGDAFKLDQNVTCDFAYPDEPLSGVTPKFECAVAPKDVVKVKYGKDNGEVFAEVAGSRLFWALGLVADRMYPVRVTCRNCPANPHAVSTIEWSLGKPGNVATREFDPAVIERKFDGDEVEVPKFEGWSWRELDLVADNEVGASRAEIDAFKLLAAFVQHVDSKPDNQALVCEEDAIGRDAQGNATCARPFLMVKDLGSTFAAASKVTFPKMKLESWRSVPVWKDSESCQANLTSSIVGTLEHPRITEAGRKFLADRLTQLTDRQLHDLFTAARVERRKDTFDGRQPTAADWVNVFKAKRAQIVSHRCPTT
jgi:hypothetical protein